MERDGKHERTVGLRFVSLKRTVSSYRRKIRTATFSLTLSFN